MTNLPAFACRHQANDLALKSEPFGGRTAEILGAEAFAEAKRDAVYYVRAIEAPAALIHGSDPLRCRYDETGKCVEIEPCGATAPIDDDCLSEAEPRAWSSPIYVDYAGDRPSSSSSG